MQQRVTQARVLSGAVVGCATGVSALLLYTNGLFVAGLTTEFGLTRTQFGLGVLLVTLALAAANPAVGWVVDRHGAKWPAVAGLLMLATGFAVLGLFVQSTRSYLLLQPLVALAGAASGPIAFSKLVTSTFRDRRGIALGITMAGIGIAAALVPPLLAALIAEHGWRSGYLALSVLPLAGAIAVALLVPAGAGGAPRVPVAADLTSHRWARAPVFWILAAASAVMSVSFMGLLPHFVPMLLDGGVDPVTAGRIAGQIGLAVIASRLVVGWALDRVFAPRVAMAVCLIAAAGCLLYFAHGPAAATPAAIGLGFAVGAELDLVGFLVSRYFGPAQFGRVYGWQYGAFIAASGVGPLWVGALRDATGDYQLPLLLGSCGLVVACAIFLLLPRYAGPSGRQ